MGKQQKQGIGNWMSLERLRQKHAELEQQLQEALRQCRPDEALIKRIKRDKLLCKDLIATKQRESEPQKKSAEVVPLPKRERPTESLFLGTPLAARFAVSG